MASIIKFSINLDKIPKDAIIKGKSKWLPMTLTINDEVDQYGNQGPVVVEQSKEQREAKAEKVYLGNAKVVWTNDINVAKAPYQENGTTPAPAAVKEEEEDDLPF